MYSKQKSGIGDLSDMTDGASKIMKKAEKCSPRMKKEIRMTSHYYGGGMSGSPCAKTDFDMHIDCNMVKLAMIIMACILTITVFCAVKRKLCRILFKKAD